MKFEGARAAIIQSMAISIVSPQWDYSYRPQDDKRVKSYHERRAKSRLDFARPGKERRGKRAANNLPAITDLIQASQIIKCVDEQPEPVKSWLYFAYGSYWTKEQIQRCHNSLIQVYAGENERKKFIFHQLASIALEDMRGRLNNGQARYKPTLIAKLCNVAPQNYPSTLRPKFRKMQEEIAQWNEAGLGEVAKVINLMNST